MVSFLSPQVTEQIALFIAATMPSSAVRCRARGCDARTPHARETPMEPQTGFYLRTLGVKVQVQPPQPASSLVIIDFLSADTRIWPLLWAAVSNSTGDNTTK